MKKHSAFSLMELSVVIIIIGILVAGVTQGGIIIRKAKLNTAKTLTKSSPVSSIDNLMLWYETSLESSFDSSVQFAGTVVGTWYDNNTQSSLKTRNNATQTISASKPKFYENVFNGGIPAIRFDGTDDCLPFDGSLLVASEYTLFVVEQKRAAATTGFAAFIGGTTNSSAQNLFFGYLDDTTMRLANFGYTVSYADSVFTYSSPKPRIHSARFSTSGGMSYFLNGTSKASSSSATTALTSYTGSAIGRRNGSSYTYFNGDIAEIIIYTRDLETTERQAVEDYLSKKYGIKIS